MIKNRRILVLAPHTDDGEFGCGGTINKLLEENEVFYVAFSACQKSVLPPYDADVLKKEVVTATAVLGIKKENLTLLDYDVRTFSYRRQDILEDILKLRKEVEPDIVFMPTQKDIHQDHFTITKNA